MANCNCGVEADPDVAAVLNALLDEVRSCLGDWQEAFHQESCHTRDEDQNGTKGDADGQDLGDGACDVSSVEVCNAADDEADDGADEQRLAEDAKALLHGLDVDVDVTNARDLID